MTVKLKDKTIDNWTDYVFTKFSNQSIYEIEKQKDERVFFVKKEIVIDPIETTTH